MMSDERLILMPEYAKQYALTLNFQDDIDQLVRYYGTKGYQKEVKPVYDAIIKSIGRAPRPVQVYAIAQCLLYLLSHTLVVDKCKK